MRLRAKDALVLAGFVAKPGAELDFLVDRLPVRRWRARRALKRLLSLGLVEMADRDRYTPTETGKTVARNWLMSAELAAFEPAVIQQSKRDELKSPFQPDSNPWL